MNRKNIVTMGMGVWLAVLGGEPDHSDPDSQRVSAIH